MENRIHDISQRIKELRDILGIDAEEMARCTELPVDKYLELESGNSDFTFTFIYKCAKRFGVDVKSSCLCGGGAKSKLWRLILANVLDIELNIPVTEQGPGYGAAILAMVGAGDLASVREAADQFFSIKETVKPDRALSALYAERYEKYRRIYPAVKNLYQNMK